MTQVSPHSNRHQWLTLKQIIKSRKQPPDNIPPKKDGHIQTVGSKRKVYQISKEKEEAEEDIKKTNQEKFKDCSAIK